MIYTPHTKIASGGYLPIVKLGDRLIWTGKTICKNREHNTSPPDGLSARWIAWKICLALNDPKATEASLNWLLDHDRSKGHDISLAYFAIETASQIKAKS
jgi:hypothetical protein